MSTALKALTRKTGHKFLNEVVDAHERLLEEKLKEVLDRHSVRLGVDGVDLFMKNMDTEGKTIAIVYELRKNGVMLETFGFELDLTSPV